MFRAREWNWLNHLYWENCSREKLGSYFLKCYQALYTNIRYFFSWFQDTFFLIWIYNILLQLFLVIRWMDLKHEFLSFDPFPHILLLGIGHACFISKEISKKILSSKRMGREWTLETSLEISEGKKYPVQWDLHSDQWWDFCMVCIRLTAWGKGEGKKEGSKNGTTGSLRGQYKSCMWIFPVAVKCLFY